MKLQSHFLAVSSLIFSSLSMAQVGVDYINVGSISKSVMDNWECSVVLCLANPQGPTATSECKPPIEKLWSELKKGKGFPSCNGGSNQWVSIQNCPPQYLLRAGPDRNIVGCKYIGVVTLQFDNEVYSRVWWNGQSTVTEPLSKEAKASSNTNQFLKDYEEWEANLYQEDIEAWRELQIRKDQQQLLNKSNGNGG